MLVDDGQHHFLQGAVPTPHGTIELEINVTRGSMRVTVPSRTVAQRIGFPTLGRGLRSVVCATPAAALRCVCMCVSTVAQAIGRLTPTLVLLWHVALALSRAC